MTHDTSLEPEYFTALYARDPDPWRFATSEYEREKYAATLDALPRPHFGSAFEVGCSIGVLTRQLAARCGRLLAVDVAPAALHQAQLRCADRRNVDFALMRVPQEWPERAFDLVLLSEVLYYLVPADIALVAALTRTSLRPRGAAVLVHYTLPTDYPVSGDDAANAFIAASGFRAITQRREAQYRLDVLAR
jgi:SAM-dependent methyltransferase